MTAPIPTGLDDDALDIECPQCGQPAGRRCLDYSSRSSFWLHVRDIPPDVLYAVSRVPHKARKVARAAAKQARLDAILDEVVNRAFGPLPHERKEPTTMPNDVTDVPRGDGHGRTR